MVRRIVLFFFFFFSFHRFEVYAVILERSTLWRGCVVKPYGFPLALCLTALGLFRCFFFRFVGFFFLEGVSRLSHGFCKTRVRDPPAKFRLFCSFHANNSITVLLPLLFCICFFVTRLSVHGVILGRSFLSWSCMVKRCVFPLALGLMALGLFWCFFCFFSSFGFFFQGSLVAFLKPVFAKTREHFRSFLCLSFFSVFFFCFVFLVFFLLCPAGWLP